MEVLDYTWYQEAAYQMGDFEQYPKCYTDTYLNPGYISEVGEFAGKIAKTVRGDDIQDEDVMMELGDCAWMIATKARLHGEVLIFTKNDIPQFYHKAGFEKKLLEAFLVPRNFTYQWLLLKYTCESLGFPFDKVLKMNNRKLESRKTRNVIKGNGDNR